MVQQPGMVGLAPKWVRLTPNGTNPGRQMHLNLIWKIPGFVPFGANLTQFGAKPTIPDPRDTNRSVNIKRYNMISLINSTFAWLKIVDCGAMRCLDILARCTRITYKPIV